VEKKPDLAPEVAALLQRRKKAVTDQEAWRMERRIERLAKKQKEMDSIRMLDDQLLDMKDESAEEVSTLNFYLF
jgi:hypothetical protein